MTIPETTIYATFDEAGRPTGFWPIGAYPDRAGGGRHEAVPPGAIAIDEVQWRAFLNHQGFRRWGGSGVEPYEPPAPPPTVPAGASKLGLKRALAERGEWVAVRAALASDPDLAEDWALATEIRRADPLVQAMIAARGYSEEEVDALLIRSAELVG